MTITAEGIAVPSFWDSARATPGKPAITMPDGQSWTFEALAVDINRMANVLQDLGLEPGATVAVMLPNLPAFLQVFLAAMQIGLYFVPMSTLLQADEVAYILADSKAECLVVASEYAERISRPGGGTNISRECLLSYGPADGFIDLGALLRGRAGSPPKRRTGGMRLLYTSGTTGSPKAVLRPLSGRSPEEAMGHAAARILTRYHLPMDPNGTHLVCGPLYHGGPQAFAVASLNIGQRVVLMERFDAEQCLQMIERFKVTTTHMVPTMFYRLLRLSAETRQRYNLSSLLHVVHAAAPCPPETKRQMIAWLGPIVDEYYSSTEGGGTHVTSSEWMMKPGSVGRPYPGAAVRILDDTGASVPSGESGAVFFRLNEPFTYLNAPDKTNASRIGDFFTVGDIGYVDDDGYLFLNDRKIDMIISGGVNVYPAEVEAVLMGHPAVVDVAVIGVPSDEWGEEVKALVQVAGGLMATSDLADQLIKYCRAHLAAFKCPRSVEFLQDLPRLPNGKIPKARLREAYRSLDRPSAGPADLPDS